MSGYQTYSIACDRLGFNAGVYIILGIVYRSVYQPQECPILTKYTVKKLTDGAIA